MKEYSYSDIREITQYGILFTDGYELSFKECNDKWCADHGINGGESYCVAIRDSLEKTPYFLFWCKDKVKVLFDLKGIFNKKKNKSNFAKLQKILNGFGFSSYDLS